MKKIYLYGLPIASFLLDRAFKYAGGNTKINFNYFWGLVSLDRKSLILMVVVALTIISALFLGKIKNFTALLFIALGAFSNIYDRFVFGGVLDYLHLTIDFLSVKLSFNLADVMIILGIILYADSLFRNK